MVPETFYISYIYKDKITYRFSTLCVNLLLCIAMLFLDLLSIENAEENDFVVNYSPRVWKGAVNVWLAMYYDTDSKYSTI